MVLKNLITYNRALTFLLIGRAQESLGIQKKSGQKNIKRRFTEAEITEWVTYIC